MLEWFLTYDTVLYWIAGGSLAAFAATLAMIPWLVLRIPADYFTSDNRQMISPDSHRSTAAWLLVRIMKNAAGLVFVTAGLVMLFTPGQGLLTIIIGLGLMNFPG
ncbi:MAG: hypothetical protein KFF46_08965, partial [Desulfobacterales bacterium]|nr:hypothetical protein [Desulfobacterales bacterium]